MLYQGVNLAVKGGDTFQGRKVELQPHKGRSICSKAAGVEVKGSGNKGGTDLGEMLK